MPGVGGIRVRRGRTASGEGGPGSRRDRCPHGAGRRPGGGRPRAGRAASGLGGVGAPGHVDGLRPAIDAQTLVLAWEGDLRQERIPLDRIERLVMGGRSAWEALTNSTGAEAKAEASAREDSVLVPGSASVAVEGRAERGFRVLRKVRNGALSGVLGGFAGMAAGVVLGAEDCGSSDGDDPWCGSGAFLGALLLGTTGYTVGAAVGVSWEDPHDRFILALAGSAAGVVAGWALVGDPFYVEHLGEFWPLFAAPAVFATLVSELTRNPPEDRRLALRLSPHPGGGFAVAALRF